MKDTAKIRVHAGPHERRICPISVSLPWEIDPEVVVELRDTKTGKRHACQLDSSGTRLQACWILDRIRANGVRKFNVRRVSQKKKKPKSLVSLSHDSNSQRVDVLLGKKHFTSYHYGSKWVRPFLHPVAGPGQARVTRNWPVSKAVKGEDKDHAHHKSIWVAYGECSGVDNWSEEPGHGWQRHRAFSDLTEGPVFARIAAVNDWCDKNEKKQFEERRDVRVYAVGGAARLMDIQVAFHMSEERVVFTDTKEGGLLSLRVAGTMEGQKGGRIENSYGAVGEAETWGKNAPWCDYSGQADGVHAGIAVFDHENNPRYPTGWHVRDYGLMTANCFAWSYFRPHLGIRGDMTFEKGATTSWRYRIYIHRGDAKTGRVRDRFLDFVAPPRVELEV